MRIYTTQQKSSAKHHYNQKETKLQTYHFNRWYRMEDQNLLTIVPSGSRFTSMD